MLFIYKIVNSVVVSKKINKMDIGFIRTIFKIYFIRLKFASLVSFSY